MAWPCVVVDEVAGEMVQTLQIDGGVDLGRRIGPDRNTAVVQGVMVQPATTKRANVGF